MTRAKNYFAWQSRLVLAEAGQRVVEAGCGIGNFTGLLLDRELVVAVDPEAACIHQLRARYGERANLRTLVSDISSPEFQALAALHPDTCLCVNVLEHIADDAAALAAMAAILEPGGVVVLLVPAVEARYGPIDRNLGHYRRYRRRDIERLAANSGLAIGKLHYVNAAGLAGWWMNAHVLRREAQSDAQIAFFDRFIVPLMARAEALIPPPAGQSLLAVLKK